MQLQRGEVIKLRAYRDEVIERRVVAYSDRSVYVCLESEFQEAYRNNREPDSIGFSLSDVIRDSADGQAAI